jgi:hypothetical protein
MVEVLCTHVMKPVKIILKVAKGNKEGVHLIKVHCMHVRKYHNEALLYREYMLIKT